MFFPLLLLALGVGASAVKASKPASFGGWTPERRVIFQNLLGRQNPPYTAEDLEAFAAVFGEEGLKDAADILRKRARMRKMTPVESEAMTLAFQRGMTSKDSHAVRMLANAFEADAFFDSASRLREYAASLDMAAQIAEVPAPAPSASLDPSARSPIT